MKFFAPIAAAAALLFVCGCETKERDLFSRQIEIRSVPAGAPIVVDGLKMGKAPLSVRAAILKFHLVVCGAVNLHLGIGGLLAAGVGKLHKHHAIPQDESLHTQIVTFPAFRISDPEKSRVPETIIFDMTKSPAQGGGVSFED